MNPSVQPPQGRVGVLCSGLLFGVFPSKDAELGVVGTLLQLHELRQNREGVSSRVTRGQERTGASVSWAVLPRCCHPSQGDGSSVPCPRPHAVRDQTGILQVLWT